MDKRKMNSIATWVTEYEIYEYYWSILHDILNNETIKKHFNGTGIDSDDISLTRLFCDNVFHEITGESIYYALGAAYGYNWRTVRQKIDREFKRWNVVSRVIANDKANNKKLECLTDKEKELAFQADFVRRVLNSKKRPPILPLNKRVHWITEEDIVTINQIIMNRVKKVYGDSTLSQISPSLKKFYDYIAEHYDETTYKYCPVEYDNKLANMSFGFDNSDSVKTTESSDGDPVKRAVEGCAEHYDKQGCQRIDFQVTLENGHIWSLSLNRMPWEERREEQK